MQAINDFILAAAGQPWVLLLVLACCIIDGFFPPIPSESVVVGLAAVSASAGVPNAWLLVILAAVGAFTGDNIAYVLGRNVRTRRCRWMQSPHMLAAFRSAGRGLRRRAASLIIGARFVPVGRVAVNFTAGATHFPHRRFIALTTVSGSLWACYSVAVGLFFGQWFKDNHLLAAITAILCAVSFGIVLDLAISRFPRDSARGMEGNAPG